MKKGFVSFIIYTLLFLLSGVMSLVTYVQIETFEGGLEGLGLALLFVIYLAALIASGVAFIIKLVHFFTGWKFLGFLASVMDLGFIAYLVYTLFQNTPDLASFDWGSALPMFGVIAALIVAYISDLNSLRN